MSQIVVAQRMWQRRDTAANWTTANPVLAAGEFGVELGATTADPQLFKIGNGATPWVDLAYAGGVPGGGGSVWRDGTTVPDNSLGANGDYYLRTTNGDVYAKAAGVYTVVGNIKGAPGAPGDPGPTGPAGVPGPASSCFPVASFDGGLGNIVAGSTCDLYVPFGFEITGYTLLTKQLGSILIDVRVAPYGSYPPDLSDSICGAAWPAVAGGIKAQDATLTGWDTSIASGSTIRFVVLSCVSIKQATLLLEGFRT